MSLTLLIETQIIKAYQMVKIKNDRPTLAKIFINFSYWLCVLLAFPFVAMLAQGFGYSRELDYKAIFEITKYFDDKLLLGLVFACLIFYFVSKLVSKLLDRCKPDLNQDMPRYVKDEIFSQIVGIGSIINVIIVMQFFVLFFGKSLNNSIKFMQYWWFGLVLWFVAAFMDWLRSKDG